ncbi:MAG: hypothetical protein IPL61_21795 [Myxococcales bacterium]|nr:hypothetical protein [Myxococcales bacterium]
MTPSLKHGMLIAMAAGSLFAAACKKADDKGNTAPAAAKPEATKADPGKAMPAATTPPAEQTAKVHCSGVNACKGQGGCKTAANACAGQNGCKGQGFVDVPSEDDCKTKGGTVMAGMM